MWISWIHACCCRWAKCLGVRVSSLLKGERGQGSWFSACSSSSKWNRAKSIPPIVTVPFTPSLVSPPGVLCHIPFLLIDSLWIKRRYIFTVAGCLAQCAWEKFVVRNRNPVTHRSRAPLGFEPSLFATRLQQWTPYSITWKRQIAWAKWSFVDRAKDYPGEAVIILYNSYFYRDLYLLIFGSE